MSKLVKVDLAELNTKIMDLSYSVRGLDLLVQALDDKSKVELDDLWALYILSNNILQQFKNFQNSLENMLDTLENYKAKEVE